MTGVEISIDITPQKRQEFLRTVEALSAPAHLAPGCISAEVYEKHGKQNEFLWLERWPSNASAEERTKSESFHALLGAIKVLGDLKSLEIVRVDAPEITG
jgi:quinol monooxygenase YgiN